MTIDDFPVLGYESRQFSAQENWSDIRESLFNGTYETKTVRRVEISKGNTGKTRPLVLVASTHNSANSSGWSDTTGYFPGSEHYSRSQHFVSLGILRK